MPTLFILMGFGLMLFMPCAIALMGRRDPDDADSSAYADRLVASATAIPDFEEHGGVEDEGLEIHSAPRAGTLTMKGWGDMTDPPVAGRIVKSAQARMELDEVEMLRAHAVATRAHAETLAAIARSAAVKAEAAAQEAMLAEEVAARAIQEMRRVA